VPAGVSGGGRRGRRDNGLSAAEYAVVGDVDPRVGEHLLDVLAGEGIAAYLQPAADLHPVIRSTTLPARPTDRLYADRRHLGTAAGHLARLRSDEALGETLGEAPGGASAAGSAPGVPAQDRMPDLDAAWASIVAGFDREVDPADRSWPAAEETGPGPTVDDAEHGLDGLDGLAADPTGPGPDDATGRPEDDDRPASAGLLRSPQTERSLLDALDTFGVDLPDDPDDDEGYTPPPPPPLPRPSAPFVLGLIGVAVGLAFILAPGLSPVGYNLTLLLGLGTLVAGAMTLVWRLRPGTDDEDPSGDDGAVV